MIAWLSANIWTILITAALALVVALIVVSLIRDRRRGKHVCGGNCANCKMCCSGAAKPGRR